MSNRFRNFAAGFTVSLIVIGAICGFALVDLSTDKYAPGQVGSIFSLGSGDAGYTVTVMGVDYVVSTGSAEQLGDLVHRYRGLLPVECQIAAKATRFLSEQDLEFLSN